MVEAVGGTLTITDGQTNYLNRTLIEMDWDITNDSFTFGKYEMRAAQPKGDFIWTEFNLICYEKAVDILLMRYKQDAIIEQDFILDYRSGSEHIVETEENLNDFHIYSVEFNETEIIWKIDGTETYRKNISGIFYQNSKFRIELHFNVGGYHIGDPEVNVKPFEETDCPSLIIDYIRYYELNEEEVVESNVTMNTLARDDICKQIKISNE